MAPGVAQGITALNEYASVNKIVCHKPTMMEIVQAQGGKLAHKGPCHYVTAPGPGCDPLFQVTDLLICLGCVERHFNPPCTLHHGCATKYIPDPAEERLGKRCPRCAIMDGSWLPPAAGGTLAEAPRASKKEKEKKKQRHLGMDLSNVPARELPPRQAKGRAMYDEDQS